jgi:hypothetical protein
MKVLCTQMLRGRKALPVNPSTSRRKHRESDVWHRRFWEHTIQDDDDFEQHLHYIHYNPVKIAMSNVRISGRIPAFSAGSTMVFMTGCGVAGVMKGHQSCRRWRHSTAFVASE